MFITDLLGWWYSRGWAWAVRYFFVTRMARILDFFSIVDLLKTLFAPFRQDTLQLQGAPIGVRLQALAENIISRVFGLIIRLGLIVAGVVVIVFNCILAILTAVLWPLIPATPVVSLVLVTLKVGV